MCEAIGEARRHRPCLRFVYAVRLSERVALHSWLFYVLGVKIRCERSDSERSSGMNFMHAENLGPWGIARRSATPRNATTVRTTHSCTVHRRRRETTDLYTEIDMQIWT